MPENALNELQLAILRYARDHEETTAAAVAVGVLRTPRTTFGRPVKLAQAETELADLVTLELLAKNPGRRRAVFTLTPTRRQLLRDAPLAPFDRD